MTDRQRGWLLTIAGSSALLILPLLVWFLLPNRSGPLPKRLRSRPAPVVEATELPPSAPAPAPQPRPQPIASSSNDAAPTDEGVAGKVVDPDGQPAVRAFVGCEDRNTQLNTTTDEDGRFRLPIEASGCSVVAHHPQFPSSDPVRVDAGRENIIKLSVGGTIDGTVVDEQGRPITSYRLAIELYVPKIEGTENGARARAKQINEPTGAFHWDRLSAGKYVLVASVSGQPPGKSDTVTVDVGQTTRGVRIVLPRPATLTGIIRDDMTRKPIAGATVSLDGTPSSAGPEPIAPATTDEQGNYSLAGVPPGPFSIRVEHDGYTSRIVAGLTTRGASSMREDIALKPRGDGGARSELEGIGAALAPSPYGVVIAGIIPESPAAKANLHRGDVIVRIDGTSASEMLLSDVMQRLRGPEGSRVSLTVSREGEGNIDVSLVRARIEQ